MEVLRALKLESVEQNFSKIMHSHGVLCSAIEAAVTHRPTLVNSVLTAVIPLFCRYGI